MVEEGPTSQRLWWLRRETDLGTRVVRAGGEVEGLAVLKERREVQKHSRRRELFGCLAKQGHSLMPCPPWGVLGSEAATLPSDRATLWLEKILDGFRGKTTVREDSRQNRDCTKVFIT